MSREAFVERFGEAEAQTIEQAALTHVNGLHDERGSDPFRWALLICIGYECMEVASYREKHGIIASWDDLSAWMQERPEWFAAHDGDVDYIAMFAGSYDSFVGKS